MKQMKQARPIICILLSLCILASFIPATASASGALPFTDVSENAWYRDSVEYVYTNGIMGGTAADKFSPGLTTTRGMIVTVLHRLEGEPSVAGENYSDVADGKYYAAAVAWASAEGIVTGYGNGKFGPNDPITREQLATILYRYSGVAGITGPARGDLSVFADSSRVSSYAREAMSWAVGEGLISGVGNNMLDPSGSATRAQVAAILTRMLSNIPSSEPVNADEPSGGYGIYDLSVSGGSVIAAVSFVEQCNITIEVFDEDENKLYTHISELSGSAQLESVSLPMDFEFPEYFIIKAVLTDNQDNALCNSFTSIKYTRAYAEFAAMTESDYDSDKLIDLLDENDGNFALLQDDVIMLGISPLSSENGVTVFPASELAQLGLKKGDKICFVDAEGSYATRMISEIQLSGDLLYISEDTDSYISDFYKIIKIDTPLLPEKDMAAAYGHSSGSSSDGSHWLADIEMGSKVNNSFSTPFGSFGHSTSVGGKLEFAYNIELFGDSYIEVTMIAGIDTQLNLEIGPHTKLSDSLEIASIPLAGLKDIADIPMELSLNYEIDCDAGLDTTIKMEAAMGLVYNSSSGAQKVEYKDISIGEMKLEGEVEAKFGLEASINAALLDDKLKIGLGAEGGVGWTGRASAPTAPLPGSDSYHACALCVDGTTFGFFEVDLSSDVELSKKLSGSILDIDFLYLQWTICRFYVSLINEPASVHKGKPEFDLGECPNKKYRADFSTYYGNTEEKGIVVSLIRENGSTDAGSSPYRTYLYPGSYAASATIKNMNTSESFSVSDIPVNIRLSVQECTVSGTVKDTKSGKPISGALVSVSVDGEEIAAAVANTSGRYSLTLPQGDYNFSFSAEDYESYFSNLSVYKDITLNVKLKKLIKPGSLEGIVTDKDTGEAISGASVTASAKDGTLVTASTDSSGHYSMELPADKSYDLVFSSEAYISEEDSLRVEDSGEYQLSKALRPYTRQVTIEVLKWGTPYSGKATVEIYGIGSFTTDTDGKVTINIPETVADGSYTITARTDEYYGNATLTIPGDDFIRVDAFMLIHVRPR